MNTKGKTIQSLERGFMILETLSFAESPLSLQDITQSVKLAKTTVYGLLATLVKLGYVERTKQTYQLGLRLTIRSPRGRRESLIDLPLAKYLFLFNPQLKRMLRMQGALTSGLEREIEQISQQGFSLDLEQAEPGLHCLAIPLYMNGDLVAAAGLSGAADELTEAKLRHFAQIFLK